MTVKTPWLLSPNLEVRQRLLLERSNRLLEGAGRSHLLLLTGVCHHLLLLLRLLIRVSHQLLLLQGGFVVNCFF